MDYTKGTSIVDTEEYIELKEFWNNMYSNKISKTLFIPTYPLTYGTKRKTEFVSLDEEFVWLCDAYQELHKEYNTKLIDIDRLTKENQNLQQLNQKSKRFNIFNIFKSVKHPSQFSGRPK